MEINEAEQQLAIGYPYQSKKQLEIKTNLVQKFK